MTEIAVTAMTENAVIPCPGSRSLTLKGNLEIEPENRNSKGGFAAEGDDDDWLPVDA
jgi:hypothetical protein